MGFTVILTDGSSRYFGPAASYTERDGKLFVRDEDGGVVNYHAGSWIRVRDGRVS